MDGSTRQNEAVTSGQSRISSKAWAIASFFCGIIALGGYFFNAPHLEIPIGFTAFYAFMANLTVSEGKPE